MADTDHAKTTSAERNGGRQPKQSERDRCTLKRIVPKNHRTAAAKVTAELNIRMAGRYHKNSPTRAHKFNTHWTSAIAKPLITENTTKRQNRWCDDDKTWTSDDCRYVICSDASSFMLFPTSGRMPKEANNPECLVQTVTHGGVCVKYLGILLVLQLFWVVELLPVNTWTFQVTRCIFWSRCHLLNMMQFSRWQFAHTNSQKCSVLVWGPRRCTSTFSLANTIARLKYHRTTVAGCKHYGGKHSPSSITSQATTRCSSRTMVQYSTGDCSQLVSVYCKKGTSCITGKWWPNSILIKKRVSFTTVHNFVNPLFEIMESISIIFYNLDNFCL